MSIYTVYCYYSLIVLGKIGSDCTAPVNMWACVNIPNSLCGNNNKCQCNPGFESANRRRTCICPAGQTLRDGYCVDGRLNNIT